MVHVQISRYVSVAIQILTTFGGVPQRFWPCRRVAIVRANTSMQPFPRYFSIHSLFYRALCVYPDKAEASRSPGRYPRRAAHSHAVAVSAWCTRQSGPGTHVCTWLCSTLGFPIGRGPTFNLVHLVVDSSRKCEGHRPEAGQAGDHGGGRRGRGQAIRFVSRRGVVVGWI